MEAIILLFINSTKLYRFKVNSKRLYIVLGNILKYFTTNNLKKIGLKIIVHFFSVEFYPIDTNDILDIDKYLMK